MNMRKKIMNNKILMLIAIVVLGLFLGCSGDDSHKSTTNPNPETFTPKGTVSGLVRDAVSNVALVGAKVSIMDKSATTDEAGLFTIKDVPALNGAGNEPANGNPVYPVVIDMTNVNSKITSGAKYPSMAYANVDVLYSSLGDTSVAGNTSATNHDTPVDGFVANITPFVGKLDANVKIQVVSPALAAMPGATVYLFYSSAGTASQSDTGTGTNGNPSTGTYDGGAPGKLIGTATSDANGYASFTGIEAKKAYVVKAVIGGYQGWWAGVPAGGVVPAPAGNGAAVPLIAPSDNLTDIYGLNQGAYTSADPTAVGIGAYFSAPIVVGTVDGIGPFVLATSPATLSDVAVPAATLDVTFTFSEPIKMTGYAANLTRETSVNGGLWTDVAVNYQGPKAGNMPYTLAWNTAGTTLTVSIPGAAMTAQSRYQVAITNAIKAGVPVVPGVDDRLKDVNGNVFAIGANAIVSLTTSGGFNVAAPTVAKDTTSPYTVNWTPVTNAFSYMVLVEAVAGTGYFPVVQLTGGALSADGLPAPAVIAPYAVTSPTTFSLTLLNAGQAAYAAGNLVCIGTRADGTRYNVVQGLFAGGKTYNVGVMSLNSNNSASDMSTPVTVSETKPPTPGAPVRRGLTAATEYIIDWTAVAGATQYQIWIQTLVNGSALAGYVPAATCIDPTFDLATILALGTMGSPGYIPAGLPFAGDGAGVNGYALGAKLTYNVAISTTSATATYSSDMSSPVLIEDKRGVAVTVVAIGAAVPLPALPAGWAAVPVLATSVVGGYSGSFTLGALAFVAPVTVTIPEQLTYSSAIDATKYVIAQLTATAFGTGKPALAVYQAVAPAGDPAITAVADIIPTITGIAYNRAAGGGTVTFTLNYAGTGTVAAPGTVGAWYGAPASLVLQVTPVDLNANALPLQDNGTGNAGGVIIN